MIKIVLLIVITDLRAEPQPITPCNCDHAGLQNRACGHKLHPVSLRLYLITGTEYFTCIIMPNKFVPSAEIFIAIECWDKKLLVQKD